MQTSGFLSILQQLNYMVEDPTGISGFASECIRVIAIVALVFTPLQCFLGYKLFKFWTAICGFFTFGIIGAAVTNVISKNVGTVMFVGIIAAFLGAFIAFKLYKVGSFILCAIMGFIIGYVLSQTVTLGIIISLILAVLSLFFVKPVIIISKIGRAHV